MDPLEAFFHAYVTAALWSSVDHDGNPMDHGRDESDIAAKTLKRMRADCMEFYAINAPAIHCEGAPLSNSDSPIPDRQAEMAGHDFWLTRNHHGAGFWDGDWPDNAGESLDHAAREFGGFELYIGDDGKIHGI